MILQSLKLHNIRSYVGEEMKFPEGTILLSGDIGSGKSTILLAIEFALFGVKKGQLSGTALLRNGANEGSVELKFQINENEIIIKRNLKRLKTGIKQESGYIIIDGKKTEGTATELKAQVFDLIGYHESLLSKGNDLVYRYTVYTPQEEMKSILFENTENRLNILRRLFGIDRYKSIKENALVFLRELRIRKRENEKLVEGYEGKKKELEKKKKEIEEISSGMKTIKKDLDTAEKDSTESKKKLETIEKEDIRMKELKQKKNVSEARLKEKKERSIFLKNEIESFGKRIEETDTELKKLKHILEELRLDDIDSNIEETIKKKEKEFTEIIGKKRSTEENIKINEKRRDEIKEELKTNMEQISAVRKKKEELERLQKKIEEKEAIEKSIDETEKELKKAGEQRILLLDGIKKSQGLITSVSEIDDCPTCKQKVPDEHKKGIKEREDKKALSFKKESDLLKKKQKEMNVALDHSRKKMADIREIEITIGKITTEITSGNDLIIKTKDMKKRYDDLMIHIEKNRKFLSEFDDKEILRLEKEIERLKERFRKLNESKIIKEKEKALIGNIARWKGSIEEKRKTLENNETEIKKIIENIEKIDLKNALEIEKRLKLIREKVQEKINKEEKIKGEIKVFEEKHRSTSEWISKLTSELEKISKIGNKIKKDMRLSNWMENHFINLISDIEKQVMSKIHHEFSRLFETWAALLIEDENVNMMLDTDFSPKIMQNGHDTEIINLSGGEKTAIALAYRLALNRVINDLVNDIKTQDIIMLDEPTDGFSSEQLDRVKEVLSQLQAKQIIIVSHDPQIESFVETIIRVNKENHTSTVF